METNSRHYTDVQSLNLLASYYTPVCDVVETDREIIFMQRSISVTGNP